MEEAGKIKVVGKPPIPKLNSYLAGNFQPSPVYAETRSTLGFVQQRITRWLIISYVEVSECVRVRSRGGKWIIAHATVN